jgi:hypothetical protein
MFTLTDENVTLFVIPEDLIPITPCQVSPDLYTDPALDIDMDEADWLTLTHDEQWGTLAAKQAAEAAAVAACSGCPLLDSCRTWATGMGDAVFGVAGGLTHEERVGNRSTRIVVADPTSRGPAGQVRDDLIERLAAAGLSNRAIAERLACNVRTVERRKAGLLNGKTRLFTAPVEQVGSANVLAELAVTTTGLAPVAEAKDVAANTLQPQRISPETAAIFDALIDGALRDRSEIIDLALDQVDTDTALGTAPADRSYPDRQTRIRVGARKFLMNRVDIAIRRGRIQLVKTDAKALICLEPETASAWRAHRGALVS